MNILTTLISNKKMWVWLGEEALKTAVISATSVAISSMTKSIVANIENSQKKSQKEQRGPMGFMRYR